ncbi:MAG: DUF1554 domain-containing protein [Leptospirales bacterium]
MLQAADGASGETSAFIAILGLAAPGAAASSPAAVGALRIFRTAAHYPGNMLGGGGGVTEGDSICQTEAAGLGYAGTYKALLGTRQDAAVARFACMNPDCSPADAADGTNWPLLANRDYHRASDAALIGTTTGNRIFSFPLSNGFEDSGPVILHWSGIHTNWQAPSGPGGAGFGDADFDGWTITAGNGRIGHSNSVASQAMNSGNLTAFNNTLVRMLCVQQ